jgi:hypothetical protein
MVISEIANLSTLYATVMLPELALLKGTAEYFD